jgi:hypothetical protein
MSLEVSLQPQPEAKQFLSPDEEAQVVKQCAELWTLGEDALRINRTRKEKVVKAYECQHEDIILKRKGSTGYLPWVYTAIESAHARLTGAMLPNDEDVFALVGETQDDQAGCETMTEYLKSVYKDMGFQNLMKGAIKEVLFGEVVIKIYWRKDVKDYTERTIDPVLDNAGQHLMIDGHLQYDIGSRKVPEAIYNNIYAETISSQDFIVYPVCGDISRTCCAHRVWRHKDELMASQDAGIYVNVDKIQVNDNVSSFTPTPSSSGSTYTMGMPAVTKQQGHEVKEYWLYRIKVGDIVYYNMIATIVNGKTLIRFEPNPYDYGLKPFIYCPLIQDYKKDSGLQNTGHGIADRALEIQKMGNFIINQVFDESKVKLFGYYKYKDDGVFDPAKFIARPGGMVRVGDLNNLQPVNPNMGQLSFGIQELEYLENQFEMTTGVPKFLKGVQDDNPTDTATAKRLAAEGADTRFRSLARNLNENLLKPFVKMSYVLIRQYSMMDIDVLYDIARRTMPSRQQQVNPQTLQLQSVDIDPITLIQAMPNIPTLRNMDVNIVGFENVLEKADKAAQFERFMNGLASYAKFDMTIFEYIKTPMAVRSYARYLSVDSELLRTDEEKQQIDEQNAFRQQQQAEQAQALAQQSGLMNDQKGVPTNAAAV